MIKILLVMVLLSFFKKISFYAYISRTKDIISVLVSRWFQ